MVNARTGKLYLLLAVLVYLNLFDLLSTLAWCRKYGFDQEFNPLMRSLFALHPMTGVSFKVFMILFFVIIMRYAWRYNFQLVYLGTFFIVFIYSLLLCWHIIGPVIACT